MITLYHFPRSGNSREVRLVLAEKGLEYENAIVDVMKGETRTPEFLKLNPAGKVPVLVDDGQAFYEASLINDYLDEAYPAPALMPEGAVARALVRQRRHWVEQNIIPNIGPVLLELLLKAEADRNQEFIAKCRDKLSAALVEVDQMLEGQDYLCGDFSLADVAATPHLSAVGRIKYKVSADLTNVKAWLTRLQARPSFRASR